MTKKQFIRIVVHRLVWTNKYPLATWLVSSSFTSIQRSYKVLLFPLSIIKLCFYVHWENIIKLHVLLANRLTEINFGTSSVNIKADYLVQSLQTHAHLMLRNYLWQRLIVKHKTLPFTFMWKSSLQLITSLLWNIQSMTKYVWWTYSFGF
jgi:hypothetical protein